MLIQTLLAASLAAAPTAAIAPGDAADLRCIAVFSMMVDEMPEEEAGMTGVIMYYFGRIEGRGSAPNLEGQLAAAVNELLVSEDAIKAEAKRCGEEMVAKGEAIERIGNGISARSPAPPDKK